MRGVYAVGWPQMTRERRWMAAVLACGDRAVLSHRSAAALWNIGTERKGVVDVSVTRRAELKRPSLHVRGRPSLSTTDTVTRNRIPVTSPTQTPSTQTRDARRDRAHTLAGMTPIRFTHYEIKYERPTVAAELSRIAKRLTSLGLPKRLEEGAALVFPEDVAHRAADLAD